MKAFIIIDMQNVCFKPETPRYDSESVILRINRLSEFFRLKDQLVVFVQHDGSKQNFCFPGTKEWEILEKLVVKDTDIILPKTANDAFYNSDLEALLKKKNVDEVIISGCATDFCVDATVKGALVRNCNVTVIADAHTTANRPEIKAPDVISYFNRIWNEFIPTGGKIRVKSCEKYIKDYNT